MGEMMEDELMERGALSKLRPLHYYGDYLRRLFLIGVIGTLACLPFYPYLLPIFPVFVLIAVCLVIVALAGIANPKSRGVAVWNIGIASILFFLFEYFAVTEYNDSTFVLTAVRQALALIFLFSLYYGVKTVRGMVVK